MEQMKHYQPSGALRAAKAFLAGMQKVVPAPLFNPFYNTAFPIYKQAVRHGYLRFLLNADSKRRKKVRLVYQMMPYSLVGWRGLETTYDIVASVLDKRVAGAIVECGVAQGGCAALMASLAAEEGIGRKIWLFDSYEGLPEPTEQDFADGKTGRHVQPLTKGACLGTYEQVSALLFDTLKLDRNCIFMLKGWFENTLAGEKAKIGPIAILRIDADWYESVKCCLENLYDQVRPGGFVIIDDYESCFGAQRAVDEFLAGKGVNPELVPDGRGGCHFVKP